jgi:hypothetical protein
MAITLSVLTMFGLLFVTDVAVATQAPAPSEKEAKICRQSETRTGTRIRTGRRCRTAAEWLKEDEEKARIPLSLTVTEGQPDGTARPRPQ